MCHPTDVQNLPSIIIGRMEKQPTREKVIENKNLIQSSSGPAVVLVIYEDPVIGQALTLLLDGASYWVRSIDQSSLHGSFEKLVLPIFAAGRVQLIILAFDMSVECSEKILGVSRKEAVYGRCPDYGTRVVSLRLTAQSSLLCTLANSNERTETSNRNYSYAYRKSPQQRSVEPHTEYYQAFLDVTAVSKSLDPHEIMKG